MRYFYFVLFLVSNDSKSGHGIFSVGAWVRRPERWAYLKQWAMKRAASAYRMHTLVWSNWIGQTLNGVCAMTVIDPLPGISQHIKELKRVSFARCNRMGYVPRVFQ